MAYYLTSIILSRTKSINEHLTKALITANRPALHLTSLHSLCPPCFTLLSGPANDVHTKHCGICPKHSSLRYYSNLLLSSGLCPDVSYA